MEEKTARMVLHTDVVNLQIGMKLNLIGQLIKGMNWETTGRIGMKSTLPLYDLVLSFIGKYKGSIYTRALKMPNATFLNFCPYS